MLEQSSYDIFSKQQNDIHLTVMQWYVYVEKIKPKIIIFTCNSNICIIHAFLHFYGGQVLDNQATLL